MERPLSYSPPMKTSDPVSHDRKSLLKNPVSPTVLSKGRRSKSILLFLITLMLRLKNSIRDAQRRLLSEVHRAVSEKEDPWSMQSRTDIGFRATLSCEKKQSPGRKLAREPFPLGYIFTEPPACPHAYHQYLQHDPPRAECLR